MVKIEVKRVWSDHFATILWYGYKDNSVIICLNSQAEADDWKAKMEEHYNQKDDVR